jgi:hypothetical protein
MLYLSIIWKPLVEGKKNFRFFWAICNMFMIQISMVYNKEIT